MSETKALKREANEQISKETESDEDEDDNNQNSRTWAKADPEVLASRRIIKVPEDKTESTQRPNPFNKTTLKVISDLPAPGSGFLAYTKVNAFASASGLPVPSPNSQKVNPFSSPSPVHNPFMSFVDKKEEFWKTVSNPPNDDTVPNITLKASIIASNNHSIINNKEENVILSSTTTSLGVSDKDDKSSSIVITDTSSTTTGDSSSISTLATPSATTFTIATSSNPTPVSLVPIISVAVSNGEELERCIYQVRAKLYRLENQDSHSSTTITTTKSSNTSEFMKSTSKESTDQLDGKATETSCEEKTDCNDSVERTGSESTEKTGKAVSISSISATSKRLEWIEVGTGPVKFLQTSVQSEEGGNSNSESGATSVYESRVVMRRESQPGGAGTKLLLNLLLRSGVVSVAKISERAVRLTCVEGGDGGRVRPVSFLLKTQQAQEADKIVSTVTALLDEKA